MPFEPVREVQGNFYINILKSAREVLGFDSNAINLEVERPRETNVAQSAVGSRQSAVENGILPLTP